MKVLVVTQYFYPEDFKINDAVEYLVSSGHEVRVLTALPNYPGGDFFDGYGLFDKYPKLFKGAHLYRTPIFPRKKNTISLILNYVSFPLAAKIYAFKIRKEFHPDIVLGFQLSPIWSMLPASYISRRLNIPFVLWCLDLWPESFFSNFDFRNFLIDEWVKKSAENIYRSANALAVTTKSFSKNLAQATGQNQGEICHLPNWAEDSYLNTSNEKWVFDNNSFNIVFAGNIGESQGLDVVLKAAIETTGTNVCWHFFGDGRHKNKLRKEAELLKVSNLIFHGRVSLDKLPSIYREANALLLTLKPDMGYSTTMPGKLAGYLTSGKPILTNIVGEVKELIEMYSLGFYFKGESEQDLLRSVEAIRQMSQSELEKLAENAKKYYERNFAKETVLHNLKLLLLKTLSHHNV